MASTQPPQKPRVSIGLPVYNGERYLTRALDSLLSQTFHDFELVISDNCSDDATEDICRRYAEQDPRIVYIRQEKNHGSCANFNFVFAESQGEYFKWAAYDDLCEPEYLEECIRVLDEHPEVVCCHTDSDRIDEHDQSWLDAVDPGQADFVREQDGQLKWVGHPRRHHDDADPARRFHGVLLGTTWSVDSYGLIRSSALQKTMLFGAYYGSEKVLMGELALRGPYYHVPRLLFAQRIHDEASSNLGSAQFQAAFATGDKQKPFASTRLSLLGGHFRATLRAKLTPWQRCRCWGVLLCYLMQPKKWKRVWSSVMGGQGVGGDGVDAMLKDRELMQETST